jgi:maltose alpha-D-glucosyltransferase / alpha-amylase
VEWQPETGERWLLAILQGFVDNQGSAWDYTLGYLARFLENWQAVLNGEHAHPAQTLHASFLPFMNLLGRRTGELHKALAVPTINEAFGHELMEAGEARSWVEAVRRDVGLSLGQLGAGLERLPEALRPRAQALLDRRKEVEAAVAGMDLGELKAVKIRYHGDYHLGQVLVSGNDFVIIDFEGEPGRSLAERRRRGSPLKDVAGMLRSFDYAAAIAAERTHSDSPAAAVAVEQLLRNWRQEVKGAFLEGYQEGVAGCPAYPRESWQASLLIRLFSLEKALYELRYELANRPQWVHVPLEGLAELIGEPHG